VSLELFGSNRADAVAADIDAGFFSGSDLHGGDADAFDHFFNADFALFSESDVSKQSLFESNSNDTVMTGRHFVATSSNNLKNNDTKKQVAASPSIPMFDMNSLISTGTDIFFDNTMDSLKMESSSFGDDVHHSTHLTSSMDLTTEDLFGSGPGDQ
jgi:hypothetical protein